MKLFVTGGAGFIGSVTRKKLFEKRPQVTRFDFLGNGDPLGVDPRANLIQGDLRSRQSIMEALARDTFEAIIHFAGYIESGESMKNPLKFFENNFSAGLNLIKAASDKGINSFIFSSTAGVYGTGKPPFTEESPINTTSYYSMSKYFLEEALRASFKANGLRVVVLRYFNAAGASLDGLLGESHDPETHLIPLDIKTALAQRPQIDLYGTDYPTPDGTAVRDYIHVEDLADAHALSLVKFARSLDGFFENYNVGAGRGYSNREVINMVKEVSGNDFRVVEKPRREGDWDSSFADCGKIQRELSWRARFGLREIVGTAYLWHKKNPYGFTQEQTVRP